MMKKIATFVIALSILPSAALADFSVSGNSEPIELSVEQIERKAMVKSGANYTPIDLRPYANRAFSDETAGDHKGGWSDQGSINDMRQFNEFGSVKYHEVPFDIIPEGTNNNCSVMGLRGQNDDALPTKIEIPVNNTAAGMYVLHSAPYGSTDKLCGRYSFAYTDGSSAYIDIISKRHINDFWGSTDADHARVAWVGDNTYASQNASRIHFTMLALNNPHPEKTIKNLVFETEGTGAYIMIIAVTLTDLGPYLPMDSSLLLNPIDSYWREADKRNVDSVTGSPIDVSYLLDAPAGKHGKIKTHGDGFVFEDGTKAKFWGTNLIGKACFPDKEEAEKIALTLSQNGINMVRMTELDFDGSDNIFADSESTLELDSEQMDKLCYLISCLKDKGIYTYLTITSKRVAKLADGITEAEDTADGYKIEGFFEEKLIELQKDYMKKLLTWKNPYTDCTLAEDGAVTMLEFMDSNSMFETVARFGSDFNIGSEQYQKAIDVKYNEFIKGLYKSDENLRKSWGSDYNFINNKGLGELSFYSGWANSIYSEKHKLAISQFLLHLSEKYYSDMKSYCDALGFKGVCTMSSNVINKFNYGDAFAARSNDFVSRQAVNAYNVKPTVEPPIMFDQDLGYTDELLRARIAGKPFMVSAWGTTYASPFSGDSVLAMAAISAQQGWSACQYAFLNGGSLSDEGINDVISIANDVSRMGLMPAAAIMFYSMDELESKYTKSISMEETIGKLPFSNMNFTHLFDRKTGIDFAAHTDNGYVKKGDNKYKNKNFVYDISDNVYGVRNDTTEGFVGAMNLYETQKHLDAEVDNSLSAVVLSALNGKTLDTAGRFLFTTVSRTRHKGMEMDNLHNILNRGEELVTEPVTGRFTFKVGKCRVYALDFSGQRIMEMPVSFDKNGNTVMSVTRENSAVYYEIVKE